MALVMSDFIHLHRLGFILRPCLSQFDEWLPIYGVGKAK